ncbi:nitrogen fixation protein NifM [Methylomonas montana]|uniref:nitrogen fixation protein NifM n=1 Tax=Methylomonas montana TaxID=3058963 RepID=UPI00265A80BC|nr:nitrogen fixation protein NifM [Methylomonas montana]WKJ91239.1 nitrogen fixation protein NifM [Methylomonas montana]
MSQTSEVQIEPYTLLRAALTLFKKAPAELEQLQLRQVEVQAKNEYEIEGRVLNSAEATGVVISDTELNRAYQEVRGRFEDEDAFLAALAANGLDTDALKAALYRQCKVDAVMDRVAARAPKVNEVEIGIFYHSHQEKFHKPEQRTARHILISINPDYPDNTREAAWKRINEVADTLKRKPHKFADLALKYSECPTAVQGGEVGSVVKGTLFPELDAVLFGMKEDAISDVVETEMGFHVIQCLKIIHAETMSLKKATPKIQQIMQDRYRRNCQRTWLASLPAVNRSA